MFPLNLTSKLTGVTPSQLRSWSRSGLLVPVIRAKRPPIYSFRDLVALRSIAFLRSEITSLGEVIGVPEWELLYRARVRAEEHALAASEGEVE